MRKKCKTCLLLFLVLLSFNLGLGCQSFLIMYLPCMSFFLIGIKLLKLKGAERKPSVFTNMALTG
ncbi:hypothetical protein O6H91_11G087700 [Diphasiastrum complanatum]|uniref:Uncharacterized protein n=1 Tax=Diphasiastrum complanatum TaxID=34168 RepID=A0ACC2CBF2_DIPCM|nr:hypothetical protein O6H91_11G087700 [Diphasiastrum complanatum]